jgi:hypothetical protein
MLGPRATAGDAVLGEDMLYITSAILSGQQNGER